MSLTTPLASPDLVPVLALVVVRRWSAPRGGRAARLDRDAARGAGRDRALPRGPADRGDVDRPRGPRRAAHPGPGARDGHDPHRRARRHRRLVGRGAPAPGDVGGHRDRAGHAPGVPGRATASGSSGRTTRWPRPSTRACSRPSAAAWRPPASSCSTCSRTRSGDGGRSGRGDRRVPALRPVPEPDRDGRRGAARAGPAGPSGAAPGSSPGPTSGSCWTSSARTAAPSSARRSSTGPWSTPRSPPRTTCRPGSATSSRQVTTAWSSRGDRRVFDYTVGPLSPKRWTFPPIVRAQRRAARRPGRQLRGGADRPAQAGLLRRPRLRAGRAGHPGPGLPRRPVHRRGLSRPTPERPRGGRQLHHVRVDLLLHLDGHRPGGPRWLRPRADRARRGVRGPGRVPRGRGPHRAAAAPRRRRGPDVPRGRGGRQGRRDHRAIRSPPPASTIGCSPSSTARSGPRSPSAASRAPTAPWSAPPASAAA